MKRPTFRSLTAWLERARAQMTPRTGAAILAVAVSLVAAGVNAQQRAPWGSERYERYNDRNDRYNSRRDTPGPSDQYSQGQERNVAGQFDYYALVLSWSPSYCAGAGDDDDQQCNRADGRRFSFIVHGLWPQYEKGYPENCRTARKPFVPQPLIDRTLDIMPSSRLIIHEYRKHGTCSGLTPDMYFTTARQLFSSIRIPEEYKNPFEAQFVSPGDIVKQFTRINPQIKPDMMAVSCGGAGNRLKEIRFCFSKEGQPRNCGSNEDQRRLCASNRMFVPPTRSTAHDDAVGGKPAAPPVTPPNQIPRPRLIEGPRGI
jgi:ribonuclease T2